MSKKWWIAVGVIAVVVVVGLVVLSFLGRWMMFRGGRTPFGRDFGTGWGERFERDFGPGRMERFQRGFARGCPMPFGGGMSFGRGFGPFAILGGLVHLGFFALLIGMGVALFLCCCRRGARPVLEQRESVSEPESERSQSNIE